MKKVILLCLCNSIFAQDYFIDDYKFDWNVFQFAEIEYSIIKDEDRTYVQLYDGSYRISPETYLARNYIVNVKKDKLPWKEIMHKYFHIIDVNP